MRDIRPTARLPMEEDPSEELFEASSRAKKEIKQTSKKRLAGFSVAVTKIPIVQKAKSDNKKPHQKNTKPSQKLRVKVGASERKMMLVIFSLALGAGVIACYIFLPTATVVLSLRTAPLLVDEELKVGTGSESGETSITGTAFFRDVSLDGTVPVENREVVGTKASGNVDIVNSSSSEQKIKEQSRLITGDGDLFYMQKHVFVPPNSRVSVPVEAAEEGEQGNIEKQRLDFAALDEGSRQLLYAEVKEGLTGGTGQTIAVVAESDLAVARQNAGAQARARVENEIRKELPEGWNVLEASWTGDLTSFEADVVPGDKVPEIKYSAQVTVKVMGIEQEKLINHLESLLAARLDKEYMLFPGPISYTKKIENVDWEKNEAVMSTRVTHTTIPKMNLETLREKLAGRGSEEAQDYLEGLLGVRKAEISLWPFWVREMPKIENRIALELQPERQP